MAVFSKPQDPVDEFSHQMDGEPQVEANIDGTIDEREQLEESIDGTEPDGATDVTETSSDPRDMVMGELTLRLSNTFRLEEKVIETVSIDKPPQDPDAEKETPATSSSNSSYSGSCQDPQCNDEELNHSALQDETTTAIDDKSTPLPLTSQSSDPDTTLPSTVLDDEEEKKDDSHDAQMLMCRQAAEAQQRVEEDIEPILRSQQDEVTDDEADIPMRSNINREQKVDLEATHDNLLNNLESHPSSGAEETDDNSLSGFASAKGDISTPTTPERSGHELAADSERLAYDNDETELSATDIRISEIQITSEESRGDDKDEMIDVTRDLTDDGPSDSPVSVTTLSSLSLDKADSRVACRTEEKMENTGHNAHDTDIAEPRNIDVVVVSDTASNSPSTRLETPGDDQTDILRVEDSIKQLVSAVADEMLEAIVSSDQHVSDPVEDKVDLPRESNVVTLHAASHDEWIDISSPRSTEETQKNSLLEPVGTLKLDLEPKSSSPAVAVMESASCSQSNAEVSSCYSEDSGVLDGHSVDDSRDMTMRYSSGKKKKGFFGKLKKKLTHKEGRAMKDCPSGEIDMSEMSTTSSNSIHDIQTLIIQELIPETTGSELETPNERHDAVSKDVSHPSAPVLSPGNSTPVVLFGGCGQLTDSTIVSASGCSNLNDCHASQPGERESLSGARRRQSVQASNEVAHVFRPPRQSPAALSPIYSGASSPHTSHLSTPGSGQFSTSDTHQSSSQHTRPHLPNLATPRESLSLPPQQPRKESATRQMTRLIRKDLWSTDPAQVESALLHLTEIAHDPEKVTLIARTGGILAIINCMEQHTVNAAIQIAACNALEKLALDAENELAIGEVGGVEAIQGAMMTHFGDTRVQEAAWAALWNLSCGNADCGSLNHAGLVACMTRHSDHAQVQRNACGTLANLCLDDEDRMTALAHAGGFVAIASALEKFWREEDVKNEAAHALVQLLGPAAETYDLPANHTPHPQPPS